MVRDAAKGFSVALDFTIHQVRLREQAARKTAHIRAITQRTAIEENCTPNLRNIPKAN